MAEKVILAALENDDDLLLLSSLKEEKVLAYQKLDIYNLTNDQCRTMIRFGREDINILSNALRLPEKIICNNHTVASGVEGLCIVLRRLAYPCRLEDLEPVLGRTKVEISYIFNHVIDYLYNTHNHLLSDLSRDWLSYEHLRNYAEADRNAPLENCWGFIDGRSILFVDRNKIKNWSSTVIREFMDSSFKALLFRVVLYRIFMDRLRGAAMMLEC